MARLARLKVRGRPRPTRCPEPLCPLEVLPLAVWRLAPHQQALPRFPRSYWLMRQTKTLPPPSMRPRMSTPRALVLRHLNPQSVGVMHALSTGVVSPVSHGAGGQRVHNTDSLICYQSAVCTALSVRCRSGRALAVPRPPSIRAGSRPVTSSRMRPLAPATPAMNAPHLRNRSGYRPRRGTGAPNRWKLHKLTKTPLPLPWP